MSDSTANKNSPVRLPEELRKELRREAFQRGEQTGKEPAFGDLLLEAWRAYKSIPNSDNPQIATKGSDQSVDSVQIPKVKSGGEVQMSIPKADEPWVKKLLKVLHSEKQGLPTALENNMLEFEWADKAYDELRKHKSPLVSAQATGAGRRRAAPGELTRIAGDRSTGSGHPGGTPAITRGGAAIEKAQRIRQKGEKDAPGKTG